MQPLDNFSKQLKKKSDYDSKVRIQGILMLCERLVLLAPSDDAPLVAPHITFVLAEQAAPSIEMRRAALQGKEVQSPESAFTRRREVIAGQQTSQFGLVSAYLLECLVAANTDSHAASSSVASTCAACSRQTQIAGVLTAGH